MTSRMAIAGRSLASRPMSKIGTTSADRSDRSALSNDWTGARRRLDRTARRGEEHAHQPSDRRRFATSEPNRSRSSRSIRPVRFPAARHSAIASAMHGSPSRQRRLHPEHGLAWARRRSGSRDGGNDSSPRCGRVSIVFSSKPSASGRTKSMSPDLVDTSRSAPDTGQRRRCPGAQSGPAGIRRYLRRQQGRSPGSGVAAHELSGRWSALSGRGTAIGYRRSLRCSASRDEGIVKLPMQIEPTSRFCIRMTISTSADARSRGRDCRRCQRGHSQQRLSDQYVDGSELGDLVAKVAQRRLTPFEAARLLLERWDQPERCDAQPG